MIEALNEAKKAYKENNVPIGAVIVKQNKIIASAHNSYGSLEHAEILVINKALKQLNTRYLSDCQLYTTLEPCLMCSGAIINSKIPTIYFGAYDPKSGCAGSLMDVFILPLNHKVEYYGGIMETKCQNILKQYFKAKRKL